jgi:hypothetical protein
LLSARPGKLGQLLHSEDCDNCCLLLACCLLSARPGKLGQPAAWEASGTASQQHAQAAAWAGAPPPEWDRI